ncbi:MAG: phosphate ABC transporter permease subunit PstC [Acidimicrobiia bacterium]
MNTHPAVDLSGNRRRIVRERVIHLLFLAAGVSSLVISVAIIVTLLGKSFEFLTNIDLADLWTEPHKWGPRVAKYDLATLFMGTLLVAGVAMLVATPLGLGAAIYLAEYARPRVRRILKPIIEVLAGIPSIVLGFFAIQWLGPQIVQRVSSEADAFSLAAAGLGVGLLVTPLVASVSEDAMRAVPHSLREASYGMGARKLTTVTRIVFPAAISGIVAALLLAASRAIGETMVVALAAGSIGDANYTQDVFDVGTTITAAMAQLAVGTDKVAAGGGRGAGQAYNSLFFLGLLLFLVTFALNLVGDVFVRRVRERY